MSASSTEQSFRSRVLGGETLFGLFLDLSSPVSAELCGRAGYDWLLIDLEHGAGTEADLPSMLMAIESTGAAAMVRVQSGERIRIGRALDQGTTGVMIPRMQSAAEVAEAVTFLRYPPAGVRGVALRTRGAGQGTVAHADVGQIDDRIVGIVQIESAGAVDEVDEIAATDGVDVLFVGPADLSHSLGVPGHFASEPYVAAIERVLDACRAHGKSPGILIYDTAAVPGLLEQGFRFVGIGADGALVSAGAHAAIATVRG